MPSIAEPSAASTGPHLDNRRVAAALIDLTVPAAIGAAAFAAGLSLTRGVLLVAIGWTLYYFFALESGDGQTLGKRAMKLRVVSADGSPASMEQIAKRTVVRILDGHVVGLIVMLATGDKRQRLGDIVAGTMVTDAGSAQPSVAEASSVEADPYSVASQTFEESAPKPRRRSLRLPEVRRPSLRKPSFPKSSFSKPSFAKPSFSMPSFSMPKLGRRPARRDGAPRAHDGLQGVPWYKRQMSLPSLRRRKAPAFVDPMFLEPVPFQQEPVDQAEPEPRPAAPRSDRRRPRPTPDHAPFDVGPERGDGPEPIEDFMRRDVLIEREPEVTPDGPEPEPEPEPFDPSLGLDDHEPSVELERPDPADYDTSVESVMEYEAQVERDVEHDAARSPDDDIVVKPIETVSAIDLVMEDAEERRPEDDRP